MRTEGRHAKRRGGKHLPRPTVAEQTPTQPIASTAPMPMEPADQLALNQAGWMPSPAQVIYHVHTPKPGLPAWARWAIAGSFALGGGLVVLFAVLALALSMAPGTAEAGTEPAPRPVERPVETVTAGEHQTTRVAVAGNTVTIRSDLCQAEDDCLIDWHDGAWHLINTKGKVNP